ncbi:MAG: DUF6784 domain-containing protein [Candidatus Bathyarchaeia archaeon]
MGKESSRGEVAVISPGRYAVVMVLIIALTAIMIPKTVMTFWAHGQEEGAWGGTGTEWGFLPLSIVWIIAVLMSFMGNKAFNRAEMALFTGLGAFAGVLVSHGYLMGISCISLIVPNVPAYSEALKLIPDFWVCKNIDVVKGAWIGGSSPPWSELAPYLLLEMIYMIVTGGIIICLASIFQRKFIYIDRLPFPSVVPAIVTVDLYDRKVNGSRAIIKDKWIWLGWIFGAIWAGPMTINMFYPLIPREHVFGRVPLDAQLAPIFSPYHVEGWWFIDPHTTVWYTIMPLDVLASIAIFDIIFYWIYPLAAHFTGAMAPGVSAWSYYWGDVAPGMAWLHMEHTGVWIGIGLWMIISGWKYLKDSFSRAIKGVSSSIPGDISDRALWITFILLWIIWMVIWVASGANIGVLIFTAVLYSVTMIGQMWVQSHNIEWLAAPFTWWTGHNYVFAFGEAIGAYTNPSTSLAALTARAMPQALPLSNANWSGAMPTLFAYKMCETGGVSPKTMFKSLFILLSAIAVIGVPIVTSMLYKYGAGVVLSGAAGGGGDINPVQAMAANAESGVFAPFTYWSSYKVTWTVIGIIFPIILFVLRSRFPWFFLHPAALMIWPICYGLFRSVPALIIKVAVLKIGGAKFYENVWVRIVAGFILGMITLDLIAMWALAAKTF